MIAQTNPLTITLPEQSPSSGGIYVHIPFCLRKCPYCDFYSVSDPSLKGAFLEALFQEIRLMSDAPHRFNTIYIGGGTPSLLDPGSVAKILESLFEAFSIDCNPEVTLEINPGTVDDEKLKGYQKAGVNRLSIGVQSFQDHLLGVLGRIHSAKDSEDAVTLAKQAGFENIALDLVFGIPGQTRAFWRLDLDRAISYVPDHLSCYMLTYEPKTPLARAVRSGQIRPLSDARTTGLMESAIRFLTESGYLHYEISNYARSFDKISKHNSKYWSFAPYLGLGPSAHTFLPPLRRWNHRDIHRYLKDIHAGTLPLAGNERLTPNQQMMEAIYLGLRTMEGIDLQTFNAMFRVDFKSMFHDEIHSLSAENMVSLSETRCRLTRKGILFHDGIVKRLIESIED